MILRVELTPKIIKYKNATKTRGHKISQNFIYQPKTLIEILCFRLPRMELMTVSE